MGTIGSNCIINHLNLEKKESIRSVILIVLVTSKHMTDPDREIQAEMWQAVHLDAVTDCELKV